MSEDAARSAGYFEHGTYIVRRRVSWGECDAAGIGYTPRFLEWMVTTIEQFFREVLQSPWETMRGKKGVASPFVETSLEFHAPVRVGDCLELTLRVGRIGRTSLSWQVIGCVSERKCFSGAATTVFVAVDNDAPTRIPEDMLLLLRRGHGSGEASR
jgi:4-hydroxybenzoyl-CoA thioesterase